MAPWTTIELTGTSAGESFIDLGTPGPGLGDARVFSEDLHRGDRKVGQMEVACTITRLDATTKDFTTQCIGSATLPEGQVATQGVLESTQIEREPFLQAIAGGTGAYRRSHGEVLIDEAGPEPAHFTFRIAR